MTFEQLLGLKINFHKTEILCFGRQNTMKVLIHIYLVASQTYPFRYLVLTMIYRKLSNKVQKHVEERIEKDLVDGKENIYRLEVDY
jgi:uncharacterized membrane protein